MRGGTKAYKCDKLWQGWQKGARVKKCNMCDKCVKKMNMNNEKMKVRKMWQKNGKIWQCVKWGKPDKSNKHEDCDKTWLVWQNMTSVNNSPSVTKYDKCN